MEQDLKLKVEKYLKNATAMFGELELLVPEKIDSKKIPHEFHQMAFSYYNDAKHFYESGDYINALAALEYAEGWLDAGKLLGIFKKIKE